MTAIHPWMLSDAPLVLLRRFRRELRHQVHSSWLHGHHAEPAVAADLRAVRAAMQRADRAVRAAA